MSELLTVLHLLMGRPRRDDEGATMIEYGLLASLIAVVVGVAAAFFGTQTAAVFTNISAQL